MAKKKKSKPKGKRTKSQEGYDMRNPVKSFRVPKEVDEAIDIAREKEGLTMLDISKLGLKLLEVKWRDAKQMMEEGRIIGYRQATRRVGIPFFCEDCKQWAWVEDEEDKKILTIMTRQSRKFTHVNCPNRKKTPDNQQMKTKGDGKQGLS
ncbi:MAG: hypothetical protein R6U37_07895 [Dehalococcoidia bacterium]